MNRPGQMRRHARRMNRYGLQPMIVMGTDDRLPETAAVVIFHWAWRYRSELTPLFLAGVLMLTGWLLHLSHPGWWWGILTIAVLVAVSLLIMGRRLGLAIAAERIYASAVIAAAGGWLSAAVAAGPSHDRLPQVLGIGGLILAVPWWAHRRRRARVRVERKLEAWPEVAKAVGLAGSQVMSAVVDMWGWRARFRLARGQTIDDVRAKLPAIESGLGVFRGAARVYPTADDLAHRFELRVLDADPHADAITWPGPSVETITQPIDLGPFEDATPARVLFLRRHGLLGGVSGSGKSGGLNVLMGNLTACADVVIWAVDLKRGMELGPWASCIARLATTPAEARSLLADAVAVLEARAEMLAASGQRVWQPTPDMPALVIIVDEYAELADDAPEATGHADSIARRGRAVAVTLIAATQRPTQKAMGQGALRSQMDIRISFRVRERKDVELILGQGMLTAGWHAHTLNAPGKFLISAPEHDTPRRARCYLVTDDAVTATAARQAAIRPVLDEVSQRAIAGRARTHPDEADPSASHTHDDSARRVPDDDPDAPEVILWAAVSLAPDDGISVPGLMAATGMGRRWVYYRLRELADAGRVVQTVQGTWRTAEFGGDTR
ncbi:MAG: FtsK/SpoIIIE domain-containing protein [Streptosporangiaceae bacterium]